MRYLSLASVLLGCTAAQAAPPDRLAPVGITATPSYIAPQPVTETLFGTKVTDAYRFMEALSPPTIDWMKAENRYTRTVLDAIKPRAAMADALSAFTGRFGVVQGYVRYNGRSFYEQRAPGSDDFDLMVRGPGGARKLVDIGALRAAHDGMPYAINYFLPSPDGGKVAVGISAGGSEDAAVTLYDANSGTKIGAPLDRAELGAPAWSADSKLLYVIRLKQPAPGAPGTEKYLDSTLVAWDGHAAPIPILGDRVGHGPHFDPIENPSLTIVPGATLAAALSVNGVQNELAIWLAPVAKVNDPAVKWMPFVKREDGVTAIDMRGDQIFLLSHKNAPTFQVLQVAAGHTLDDAEVIASADPKRVLDSIHAAADAVYVLGRDGAYSQLLRIRPGAAPELVNLPWKGHIAEAFADPRVAGVVIHLSGWVRPDRWFAYDPARGNFTDLKLGDSPPIDPAKYLVKDLRVSAGGGVRVPLSLILPAGAKGKQITLLEAYGSYGISMLADFQPEPLFFVDQGAAYGVCHVRGGGELGEAWRLGGKDANKHNTWQDLIACAEDLIDRGITSRSRLFIIGGSAGGITMGRAMTERPGLFAGVIDLVPSANTLRAEFSPNGPNNIPEFGSVTDREGFQNLRAMDTIQHVEHGVQYPAVLIATGLNDPRVSPWEPAKLTAALQASGSTNPVLLRVDETAGHGIGSTRAQTDALYSDIFGFAFWRAGRAGWRPGE